jgi:hypothetical protein
MQFTEYGEKYPNISILYYFSNLPKLDSFGIQNNFHTVLQTVYTSKFIIHIITKSTPELFWN